MAVITVPQALSLLQLEPGATRKQIRAAYKRLALQLHPDKQHRQQSADATAAFALLSAAYSLLQGQSTHAVINQHQAQSEGSELPPFETAYATGSLFSEQLVDEGVVMGLGPADIVNLEQLSAAAAQGQLAQHLSTHPPTQAEEQLWRQAYTRLQLRHQAKLQAKHQQHHHQQLPQQQQQQAGVCVGQLLSDLLLRPSGPLFVEEDDSEEGSETAWESEQGQVPVSLHHSQQQQQQQHQDMSRHNLSQQQQRQAAATPQEQQQQQQQQSRAVVKLQATQDQHSGVGSGPAVSRKKLRRGWGFYWVWLRRVLLAKALVSVLSSSLRSQLYEHHFPQPLPRLD